MAAGALATSGVGDAVDHEDRLARAALDDTPRGALRPIDREPAQDRAAGPRSASQPRQRVVIIGAGFGGLAAAQALAKAPIDVVVIDRHNYHLFQPLLYQVATAGLSPADIAAPIRSVLSRQANATRHSRRRSCDRLRPQGRLRRGSRDRV